MIALPGADSYRVTGIPSRSNSDARKSAVLRVSPGGFDVSMRTYCCSSCVASAPAAFQSGACAFARNDEERQHGGHGNNGGHRKTRTGQLQPC